MAKKVPVCVEATKGALWICDDDHLHVELSDHNGNPVAEIAFDPDDAVEILTDLVAEYGFLLVDPDDIEVDADAIGPVMGHC